MSLNRLGHQYPASPTLRAWRKAVTAACRAHAPGRAPLLDPVRVDLLFEIRRPLGHYTGRKRGAGLTLASTLSYPRVPDLDKLIRSTLDAIAEGRLIGNDAQVIEVTARKVYSSAQGVRIRLEVVNP